MIESMKKIEILLYHREQEEFLSALRDAGVVHIETTEENSSDKAEELRNTLLRINKAKSQLRKVETPQKGESRPAAELVDRILEIATRSEVLLNEKANLHKDQKTLEPWGDFSHATQQKLRDKGIYFTFFEVNKKSLDLLKGLSYEVIHQTGSFDFVIVFSENEKTVIPGLESLVLPTLSLSEVNAEIARVEKEEKDLAEELAKIAGVEERIDAYNTEISDELLMEQARSSMTGMTENKILHTVGWFPQAVETQVQGVTEKFSCWYETSEPTSDDNVPVKLKNNPAAKLFEPITKIFDLPDYFEIDPTPFFAPFYAFFFGLCLGDVGYGLLLIICALIGMAKLPKSIKPVMVLGMVLGVTTMIGGVLLNTCFGAQMFPADNNLFAFVGFGEGYAILKTVTLEGRTIYPAMAFSVFLGVIQILLGMALKAGNKFKEGGFLHILYPIGTMLLAIATTLALVKINFLDMATFFQILSKDAISAESVMNAYAMEAVGVIAGVGLALLFLFNNPDKKIGVRIPLGLWELYNFVVGIMGDGLSYIRLFALGLAGGLLGNAFNQIAFMMTGEDKPAALIIFTVLILILGHTINFVLAALGSFVHPLRLTFVEFYNNLEFKGGATAYNPLMKKKEI